MNWIVQPRVRARKKNASTTVSPRKSLSLTGFWITPYRVAPVSVTSGAMVPTAMKFVNYLQERELRSIMKSKDVPTPIATQARRLLQKKGKI